MGLDLAGIDNRVVVKLPITDAGIEAAAMLKKQGVLVTMTGQHIHMSSVPAQNRRLVWVLPTNSGDS